MMTESFPLLELLLNVIALLLLLWLLVQRIRNSHRADHVWKDQSYLWTLHRSWWKRRAARAQRASWDNDAEPQEVLSILQSVGWTFNEDRLRRLLGDTPACSALITEAKSLFSREGPSHPESQPSSSHGHPKRGPRRPKEQSLGFDRAYSSSSSPSFYPSFSSCSCSSSSFYPSSSSYFSMSPTRSPRSVADPLPPSAAPRDEAGMEHQHEVIKQSLELQVLENTLRKQEDLARELREAPILVSAKEDGGQESREKTLCLKPSHISGKHGWLPSNIQDPITLLEVNVRQKYLAFLLGLHDFH